jgi:Fur family peroxide stress response transcriptional regulator
MLKEKPDQQLKMTPQRMAIMEYLEGNIAHPSAADIFNSVSERFPTMSFATVYNTLQTLKEKGRLLELSLDPDKKRFDPYPSPHHHLICLKCKRIMDVHREFDLTLSKAEQHDFELIGNHVDFYGTCPECRQKGKGHPRPKSKKN